MPKPSDQNTELAAQIEELRRSIHEQRERLDKTLQMAEKLRAAIPQNRGARRAGKPSRGSK